MVDANSPETLFFFNQNDGCEPGVSSGFPGRVSLGFLGFPRVSQGFLGLPEAVTRQGDCEKIALAFGRLGFPPALQPFFLKKLKKGNLTCLKKSCVRLTKRAAPRYLQTLPSDASSKK